MLTGKLIYEHVVILKRDNKIIEKLDNETTDSDNITSINLSILIK